MVPDSLSVWIQRVGCAGRSGVPSAAVLLYEPSVTQKVKGKIDESGDEGDGNPGEQLCEGDDFKKKNVEGSLRFYMLTDQCRRAVTDEYFGTPVRNVEGTVDFKARFKIFIWNETDNHFPSIHCSVLRQLHTEWGPDERVHRCDGIPSVHVLYLDN